MATWLRMLLLLLVPLALADADLPCEGYEVREGWGMADVDLPHQLGVKVLEAAEEVEDEPACWQRCCDHGDCDLAVLSAGNCYLLRCNLINGLDQCELTEQPGVRTYKKIGVGAAAVQEDYCLPQKDPGPCRASFLRYWYDAATESCKNFTFGGCAVNLNVHMGEEECLQKCQGVKAVKSKDPETPSKRMASPNALVEECSGPGVTGNCRAAFPRWYFDAESMSCQSFIYGGCGGSKNNHRSKEDCMSTCVAPKPEPEKVHSPEKGSFKDYCAAPAVTGNCRAAFTRWFFDHESSSCKKFTYGGCKGNKNNYLTETDCMTMCSGRTEEDDDFADHSVMHRPMAAVVLPILLALLAASLIGVMILFFVKVLRKNQQEAGIRAMWTPIDDKECLMNSAYTL